ncbi:MAG: glycosyltransferase [Candidatus Kerfeldbacteria bacterium]|nr:glycosyltransferase [Candidatus Kerfeldbacteria bacterium]
MRSILLTSFNEPHTIARAVQALLSQVSADDELVVVAPDNPTLAAVPKHPQVRTLQDPGNGKPAALNFAFKELRGDLVILTDGDVYVERYALNELCRPFNDPKIGAISGHPISDSPRNTKFGFWSHLLTDAVHVLRLKRIAAHAPIECSGYLMALRRTLIDKLPEDTLGDDAMLSHQVIQKGYRTAYAPNAFVHVKYPNNYRDWLRQKVRSQAGYWQSYLQTPDRMRSMTKEAKHIRWVMSYPKTPRERFWMMELIAWRPITWIMAFWQVRIARRSFHAIWKRVESSK